MFNAKYELQGWKKAKQDLERVRNIVKSKTLKEALQESVRRMLPEARAVASSYPKKARALKVQKAKQSGTGQAYGIAIKSHSQLWNIFAFSKGGPRTTSKGYHRGALPVGTPLHVILTGKLHVSIRDFVGEAVASEFNNQGF